MTPDEILNLCEVPGYSRLYVLGALDDRLTLRSQQVRALNLAYALREKYPPTMSVAIIGAGIGGVTLASGLALGGFGITIFERSTKSLQLYADASHRWLHPRAFDWPQPESLSEDARLPLYNWLAGDAAIVTKRWRNEWDEVRRYFESTLAFVPRAKDIGIAQPSDNLEISWNEPTNPGRSASFDVVVLCVGYGTDQPSGEFAQVNHSYWDPDVLDREMDGTEVREVLISGTGDGGLLDLFRARLRDFSPARYLAEVIGPNITAPVTDELLKIALSASPDEDVARLEGLKVDSIVAALRERLRDDTSAILNGRSLSMFSSNASVLNRFMLSQLRLVPYAFTYVRGALSSPVFDGPKVAVKIDGKSRSFHRVVVRHGPMSELERSFPVISGKVVQLRALIQRLYALDPLRDQHWDVDYFDPLGAISQLAEQVRRRTDAIQPADRGERYSGGRLFLDYDPDFVEIPPAKIYLALFQDSSGTTRHLKYSPVTRRLIRGEGDLPDGAKIYKPRQP